MNTSANSLFYFGVIVLQILFFTLLGTSLYNLFTFTELPFIIVDDGASPNLKLYPGINCTGYKSKFSWSRLDKTGTNQSRIPSLLPLGPQVTQCTRVYIVPVTNVWWKINPTTYCLTDGNNYCVNKEATSMRQSAEWNNNKKNTGIQQSANTMLLVPRNLVFWIFHLHLSSRSFSRNRNNKVCCMFPSVHYHDNNNYYNDNDNENNNFFVLFHASKRKKI